jgi:hypothetical protein
MIRFAALEKDLPADLLGYLPFFLSEEDPRSAAAQLDENYAHGGGWHPQDGFTFDPVSWVIRYPGDPPHRPLAIARLRDELLLFYPYEYLAIVQPDGSFEIARVN